MRITWRNLSVLFLTGLVSVLLTGCPDDPFDPNTWIKKLDDANEVERAVVELERLGDQRAIAPLGKAWEKQGRPVAILQVIIDLSKPLTEKQAKDNYKNNGNARAAAWDKSLPILKKAIEEVDQANPRSVESARLAAEALGSSKVEGALDVLTKAANKPVDDKPEIKQLRVQAIFSLGELGDPGAVSVLNIIIREEFSPAKPELHGAAIIALGKLKSPNAIPVLIESMYRLPFFFRQVRRSLAASGGTVTTRMKSILEGTDTEVNALFTENGFGTYKGDVGKEPLPQAEWQQVSAKDYYAAVIAGDLYDPTVVKSLLVALAREPIPSYFVDSAPGPPAHNAVLDALRKIGSPESTKAVLDVWTGKNDDLKPMAANVFSFVSKDGSEKVGTGSALDALGKIAADNTADQNLRLEASVAYGRLARSKDRVSLLMDQAKKYKEASDKARKEADGPPKAAYEAQKTIYEAAKEKLDAAKADVARKGGERKAPIEMINTMTEAKVAFDKVKDPFTKAKAAWKTLDDKADAYRGYQRLFETHVARIEIAMHCKADAACYAGTLVPVPAIENDEDGNPKPRKPPQPSEKCKADWAAISGRLKAASSDIEVAKYTDEEKQEVCVAQIERAMLELGKMGTAASGAALDILLYNVRSDDRLVRQSILLALPKVAGKDCKNCGAELDAAIKSGEGKDALRELNFETQVLRSYFSGEAVEAPSPATP